MAKLLVTGGNGFIGREICRIAVELGHDVVSVSRSGRPEVDAAWAESVNWVAAHVLQPETWREHLEGCDAVIHSVSLNKEDKSTGTTFERIVTDAAVLVSWEAEHAGVKRFIFLSASDKTLFKPRKLPAAKRSAEENLMGREFKEAILRPAYVYGGSKPYSIPIAKVVGALNEDDENIPLHVAQVAVAAVKAATEEGYEGVMEADDIAYVAGDTWKTYVTAPDYRKAKPILIGGAVLLIGAGAWLTARTLKRKSH